MEQHLFWADDKFSVFVEEMLSRGWKRVADASELCNFVFGNLVGLDFEASRERIVNHLKGAQHLSNKAFLAYHLHCANHADIMPPQWSPSFQDGLELLQLLVPPDSPIFQKQQFAASGKEKKQEKKSTLYCPNPNDIWIVKPVGASCGENIEIFRGYLDTLRSVQSRTYKCVVQKYIERPLLVRNRRKFDIRQWVLVTSVDPLILYGFSECYLRLSSHSYDLSTEALAIPAVHLCNHAIQKLVPSTTKATAIKTTATIESTAAPHEQDTGETLAELTHADDPFCPTMMTQRQFKAYLKTTFAKDNPLHPGEACIFESVILPQIQRIAIATVESVRDRTEKIGFGFEWLGLDLMVTDYPEFCVKLLEVNVSPDVSLSTPVTARLVPYAVRDLCDLVLEEKASRTPSYHEIERSGFTPPRFASFSRNLTAVNDSVSAEASEPTSAETAARLGFSPHWEPWHVGKLIGKGELLAESRQKRQLCALNTSYRCEQIEAVDEALRVLERSICTPKVTGLDSEDDEI